MPELILGGGFTPEEFLRVLARRLQVPIETFSWLDLFQHEHSNAFTVAKSAGFDVLADINAALDQALANGETLQEFTDKLMPVLIDKGWWGRGPALDPQSGLHPVSQLGSARRLEIIYDTNMRVSFSAGNWASIQRNKIERPYLMYSAVHDLRTRLQHRLWDGTVLPADDPWWDTHYPPNGWNCRCHVISLSQRQFDGLAGDDGISTQAPAITYRDWTNPRTGEVVKVPEGIDPGFAYNPGQAFLAALRQAIGS
jgi:SPP1 gp7 family putative phage head morphogenesis protein